MKYRTRALVKIIAGACLALIGAALAPLLLIMPNLRYRLPVPVPWFVLIGFVMVAIGAYFVFTNLESLDS